MATYKYYLFDNNAKEETYIYLRIAQLKKTYKIYTDLKIKPKDWNTNTQEVRKSYVGYSDFNELLNERKTALKELHLNLLKEGNFSIELLRRLFYEKFGKIEKEEGDNFITLSSFAKHYITTLNGFNKRPNTILQNQQTLNKLIEFEEAKKKKIRFDNIDVTFYNDFTTYLTDVKKLSVNTIGKHITNIKLFIYEAMDSPRVAKFDFNNKKKFKSHTEPVTNIYLSEEELLMIYNYDFGANRKLEKTRDLFIVGCYTGLRFSDFSQLTSLNVSDNKITVTPIKTGETVVIPLHWTVKKIMEKYSDTEKGFPRAISNQKMNEYLKEMGRVIGVSKGVKVQTISGDKKTFKIVPKHDLITTHTARRSFATNLHKSNFPSLSIMKITGHKTEKSFMKYIKVTDDEVAESLSQHWKETNKLRAI